MRLIAQVVPDGLYSQNVCLKRVYHGRVDYTRISSCGTAHGITWTDYVFYIFRGGKGGMIVSVYQGRESDGSVGRIERSRRKKYEETGF